MGEGSEEKSIFAVYSVHSLDCVGLQRFVIVATRGTFS